MDRIEIMSHHFSRYSVRTKIGTAPPRFVWFKSIVKYAVFDMNVYETLAMQKQLQRHGRKLFYSVK